MIFYGFKSYPGLYSDKTFFIDLDTEQILDTVYSIHGIDIIYTPDKVIFDSTNAYSIKDASADGNFVLLFDPSMASKNYLYNISNNSFSKVCEISSSQLCFYNTLNCFLEIASGKITLRNNVDGSINKEIFLDCSDLYNPVIDPVTDYLGGIDPDSSYYTIIDIPTAQVIKKIKIYNINHKIFLLQFYTFQSSRLLHAFKVIGKYE